MSTNKANLTSLFKALTAAPTVSNIRQTICSFQDVKVQVKRMKVNANSHSFSLIRSERVQVC